MKKVLLIEDDETITDALDFTLGEEGYEVLCAMDGEAGLEKARSEKPDIILLDIMLPKMNGFEVCQALKSDERFKSIPIIMITGLGDTDNTVKGLSIGADDYVSKPFDFKELLARLKSHLRMKELYDIVKTEEEEKTALLDVSQSLASTMNPHETLYTIVSKIAEVIEVKRCSIIYVNPSKGEAYVMASHDSKTIKHLKVDIEKYPEIQKVVETGKAVVINDVYTDPILFAVREILSLLDVKSIMAFPIAYKDTLIGTLILRTSRRESPFNSREIRFCEVISHLAASPLKNAYLFDILHKQKEQERNGRLEAVDKLKKALVEWDNTFNAISDFVSIHDTEFRIVKANRTLIDFLGKKPEEIIGKFCYEIFHGKNEPWDCCPHAQTLESRESRTEEVNDPHIGVPLLVTTCPIFDNDGKLTGSIHIAKDISERKQVEEKLNEAFRELEEKTERLEKFNKLTVGREMDMVRLKREVNALLRESGKPIRYEEAEKIKD